MAVSPLPSPPSVEPPPPPEHDTPSPTKDAFLGHRRAHNDDDNNYSNDGVDDGGSGVDSNKNDGSSNNSGGGGSGGGDGGRGRGDDGRARSGSLTFADDRGIPLVTSVVETYAPDEYDRSNSDVNVEQAVIEALMENNDEDSGADTPALRDDVSCVGFGMQSPNHRPPCSTTAF